MLLYVITLKSCFFLLFTFKSSIAEKKILTLNVVISCTSSMKIGSISKIERVYWAKDGDMIVAGFHSSYLVVFNYTQRYEVSRVHCTSGWRAVDFYSPQVRFSAFFLLSSYSPPLFLLFFKKKNKKRK